MTAPAYPFDAIVGQEDLKLALLSSMALDNREKELTLVAPLGVGDYLELTGRLKICYVNYPLNLIEFNDKSFAEAPQALVYESSRLTIVTRPLDHRIFALGFRLEEKIKPGRFNLERARELGIPAGPLYSQLQSGKSVTLADGRVIHPSEVLGEPRPGKIVSYCLDTRPCLNAVTLAENAIKHGIAQSVAGGQVQIRAASVHNYLRLEVCNTGQFSPHPDRQGIGLANIRRRLEMLYGGRAAFEIDNNVEQNTVTAMVQIPAL